MEAVAASTWAGSGKSQQDFMLQDECLVVDERDTLLRTANKHECHRFVEGQPTGLLHRAFSVFLFRPEDNKLLLQQRTSSKVTFPSVWTNTCCSHPLHGQRPDEVDGPGAVADGSAPGIKAAAVRKLAHELGIEPGQLGGSGADPAAGFRFLTRLHYCAADTDTWGPSAQWGEHEVDYMLLLRPPREVEVRPNPEEVDAVRWVDASELRAMMAPDSGLRWSPWFRIIATQPQLLPAWWADLDATLAGAHDDRGTIHRVL